MSASQRVSRGFHRLAIWLAAIPFLVGTVASLYRASDPTFTDLTRHERLVCAHEHVDRLRNTDLLGKFPADTPLENSPEKLFSAPDQTTLNLKRMGCSDFDYDAVSLGEARIEPSEFNWYPRLAYYFSIGVGLSLLVSFAVYGIVRSIGWVIGGFVAA